MDEKNEEYVELKEINIIAKIPEHASRLTITAQYFDDDGNPVKVSKVMNAADIRNAREDFLDNVEDGDDYDCYYTITEEGRRWLDGLEAQRNNTQNKDEDFK